ncbi:putative ATP-dependent RNA helicase ddx46 [Bonamia ostreae]|uniref:ATP-dependent RNA helicase ddx46 n=1 Tax=Bonamia ostreae TaxID=126728 RepID=A0ABV2AUV1_9EUKA
MFRHILDQEKRKLDEGPIAMVLTPTRELAKQIFAETKKFASSLNQRVVCCHGGTTVADQIADLKRGADIIVATPGRMIDMLSSNGGKVTNARRVTYLALDEADRMFDMGFEPQISALLNCIRPDRQVCY